MLYWNLSSERPTHRWFVIRQFRVVHIADGDHMRGLTVSASVGNFRKWISPLLKPWDAADVLTVSRTFPNARFPVMKDQDRVTFWVNDPKAGTMSYHRNGRGAVAVEGVTYFTVRAMAEQVGRGMPPQVLVDWLRETFPIVETVLSA